MITVETLVNASAPFGLPVVGLDDFNLDTQVLNRQENSQKNYLWIVKSCGSVLLPVGQGVNPNYANMCFEQAHQAFCIVRGEVTPIETSEAKKLAYQMPFEVERCLTLDLLIDKVTVLLSRATVNSHVLATCELTEDSSWGAWKRWFESIDHPVMVEFMGRAIKHAQALGEAWKN